MSVLKYPAHCERQSWQAGGAAVHMSAASVRIRADEVRHERTDARKTSVVARLYLALPLTYSEAVVNLG